jgi:hypothetical protein
MSRERAIQLVRHRGVSAYRLKYPGFKRRGKKVGDHFLDEITDPNIRFALPSVEKSPHFSPLEDARKISKSLSGRISPTSSTS